MKANLNRGEVSADFLKDSSSELPAVQKKTICSAVLKRGLKTQETMDLFGHCTTSFGRFSETQTQLGPT